MEYNKLQWEIIAKKYDEERDSLSNSALLLDNIITEYFQKEQNCSVVVDYGAGIGTQSRLISPFVTKIFAFEPVQEMRNIFVKHTNIVEYNNIALVDNSKEIHQQRNIDAIICSKVFDHILDVPVILMAMYDMLKPKGFLILSLAHPIKYSGTWEKDNKGNYLYYKMDNYFTEGEIVRSRENVSGNQFITEVRCQHRTISTYFNWITEAGFYVKKMIEPQASLQAMEELPYLYAQASRIPNVLIFECHKQ